jgi:hypothetical protein
MARRRWTAAAALVGAVAGLWLALVPYRHGVAIGRMSLSGRCPSPLTTAFSTAPDDPFYDLGPGEELPDELCAPSARARVAGGTALGLLAGAVLVAGRTTWRRVDGAPRNGPGRSGTGEA